MPGLIAFRPLLKRIRWGGTRLGTVLGKPIGDATDAAESWEVCDHGEDQSVVSSGLWQGRTLAEVVAQDNIALFGRHAGRRQFPLLVKFLDATDRLSLQVHPDDVLAARMVPGENGKTEAWVILEAAAGSRLYAGLKEGVDAAALRGALANDTLGDCLHSFAVAPGDCVFIPAGTVHAIGEGILLAEVQQSSDVTYRLHDWGRTDAQGRPRPLHLEESFACIDFARGPVNPVTPAALPAADFACGAESDTSSGDPSSSGAAVVATGDGSGHVDGRRHEELVRCPYFVLRRHTAARPFELTAENRFRVLLALSGAAQARRDGAMLRVERGSTILATAAGGPITIVPESDVTLLEAHLP